MCAGTENKTKSIYPLNLKTTYLKFSEPKKKKKGDFVNDRESKHKEMWNLLYRYLHKNISEIHV